MNNTADTPRTDAAFGQGKHGVMKMPYETSCKLERELKASQEAYLQSIERDDYLTQALAEAKQWLDERYKHLSEADERAEKAEAEVKEIRAALGDDGRRTHKEILEMAFKASGWKLWKQKYIDLRNAHIAEGQDPAGTIWEHADKLQKELKASKAEVERLQGLLNAHAEFLIKNGFYRESRDLMGGSWSDGFVALAKKCGINPYDQ